jgi:predicted nucleotidyltransferase
MNPLDLHRDAISMLCSRYKVARLFAFGSVLQDTAFSAESDVDLVVDFATVGLSEYADNYFDLKQQLEKRFNRPVDLLEEKAIRNPYIRKAIDKEKRMLYG